MNKFHLLPSFVLMLASIAALGAIIALGTQILAVLGGAK